MSMREVNINVAHYVGGVADGSWVRNANPSDYPRGHGRNVSVLGPAGLAEHSTYTSRRLEFGKTTASETVRIHIAVWAEIGLKDWEVIAKVFRDYGKVLCE